MVWEGEGRSARGVPILITAFHIPELTGRHYAEVADLLQVDDFFVTGDEDVRASIASRGYDGNVGGITLV